MEENEQNPYIAEFMDKEFNQMSNLEAERHVKISEAKTLTELLGLLREMKEIPGSRRIFSSEEQVNIILALFRNRPGATLEHVTRTYGIRDKVRELLLDSEGMQEENE